MADRSTWTSAKSALKAIFARPEDQQAVLDGLSAELRREVLELLAADAAHGQTIPNLGNCAADWVRQSRLAPGFELGPYIVLRHLGQGGMGSVYLAERRLPYVQQVAIKLLDTPQPVPSLEAAFLCESQILATLEHPNIARILDGGVASTGQLYLVMEFVDGTAIDSSPLAPQVAVRHLCAVAAAVEYAHQRFIIHSDIKPGNILLNISGESKLLDFGVATVNAETSAYFTPGFASPEQTRGERLTAASDVYSLGRLLAHLAPTPDTELAAIIAKSTQAEPGARYSSAAALRSDLTSWLERGVVRAYSCSSAYQLRCWARRNHATAAAALAAVVFLVGGSVLANHQARQAQAARGVAEQARRQADEQRALADQRRVEAELARQSADQQRLIAERRFEDLYGLSVSYLSEFYEPAKSPDFPTASRKWMVERAQQQLARLERDSPADRRLAIALADAQLKIGDLFGNQSMGNLGDRASASAAYGKALGLLASSSGVEAVQLRVRIQMRQADLLLDDGKPAAAAVAFANAVQHWESLAGGGAQDETGRGLAVALMKHGQSLSLQGDNAGALAMLERARRLIGPLASRHPSDSAMQRTRISALSRLGYVHRLQGDFNTSVKELALALRYTEDTQALLPSDSNLRQHRAMLSFQLGQGHVDLNRTAEAERNFESAWRLAADDLKRDPRNAQMAMTAAMAANDWGDLLRRAGQHEAALRRHQDAADAIRQLAADPKAPARYRLDLAHSMGRAAWALQSMGKRQEASEAYATAVAQYLQHPMHGDMRYHRSFAECLINQAGLFRELGLDEPARLAAEKAEQLLGHDQERSSITSSLLSRARALREGRQ